MMAEDKNKLEQNAIFLLIGDYLEDNDFDAIHELIQEFHPADVAFMLNLMSDDDSLSILKGLSDEVQAEVIPDLNESKAQFVVNRLQKNTLSQIIEEMESDDAADLMGLMDTQDQEIVLDGVEEQDAKEVRELLQHPEDSAGGLMSKEVVAIYNNENVEQAIAEIRKAVDETEQIYNVFVIEKGSNNLLGILPLDALLLARPNTRVAEIMEKATSVTTTMDQEDVAIVAKKYDLVEIPVIDENGKLVGRITHDDILDVVEEEAEEDIAMMAGTDEEISGISLLQVSKARLTWLLIGLLGGIIAAAIMSKFEMELDKIIILAFFVPVIMAMGGIAGIQSSTITVRSLATGDFMSGQISRRVLRELGVGIINGSLCGGLLTILILAWQGSIKLGLIVGISMASVMIMSTFTGTLIPILLNKIKIDPAIATGPFVTTFNDVLGLSVYFFLTSIFL